MHISRIPESDGNIAQVAASLGALDGTPLEALVKLLF